MSNCSSVPSLFGVGVLHRLRIDNECLAMVEQDDVLLPGLIRRGDGLIRFFRAGERVIDVDIFPTHQSMIDAGRIVESEYRGFSLEIVGGRVAWFQRQSCLNKGFRDSSLSVGLMDRILLELVLNRREDFRDFGDRF